MSARSSVAWWEVTQTVCVVIAVPLGVLPLGQALFGAHQGWVFRAVFGDHDAPLTWILPLAVLAVLGSAVLGLEHLKPARPHDH